MPGRFFEVLPAPFGAVTVVVDGDGRLCELWTEDRSEAVARRADPATERSAGIREELAAYFAGDLKSFQTLVVMQGSDFQKEVWRLLMEIPYGQTRTYGDLARKLGVADGARAVGRANATNPISIVVPCHRVIGSTGALTGYAGGLDVKRALLNLESSGLGGLFDEDLKIA